jgi:nucleoid-associated protein YgaU
MPAVEDAASDAPVDIPSEAEPSREILRMDTEAFTLTLERPAAGRTEPVPPPDPLATASRSEITHQVVPGDTLWDIAAYYLGDPFQYPELARLSQIRNPDLIYPGDIIRIIKKPDGPNALGR